MAMGRRRFLLGAVAVVLELAVKPVGAFARKRRRRLFAGARASAAAAAMTGFVRVSVGQPTFPASFTNGPLGANNVLPRSQTGALLGAAVGSDGFSGDAAQMALQQQRIADIGRPYDVIHSFGDPSSDSYRSGWIGQVHNLGAVPMITLQGQSPTPTLANVNSGACDTAYTTIANYLKTKPYRIMLRLFHEFNSGGFPWDVPDTATAPAFVTAFRRIVGIFQTNGASNCGFIWSPGEGGDRTIRDLCYPGDAYVDWVSPDSYNYNAVGTYTTPFHDGWTELYEMFGYPPFAGGNSTYDQYASRKPFIPAEVGSKYDTGDANHKANWYRNIQSVARTTYVPNMRGIIFFDYDVFVGEGQTWRVDEKNDETIDATTYQGFKDLAASAAWNVGVAGGAT